MRLFFGLTPGPPLQAEIASATAALRESVPELAWVPAERLHVTLKFLGEIPEDRLPALVEAATAAVRAVASHDVSFEGVGGFPNLRRPRVVWLGMDASPSLARLAGNLDGVGALVGVPLESRPFRPHVTLARAKAPLTPGSGARLVQRAAEVGVRFRMTVRDVALVRSRPGAAGSHYDVLSTIPLIDR